jgi:NAD-dependent deacetylase
VLEIHGTFNTLTCVGCFKKFASETLIQPYLENGDIPHCPECRRLLKPDVILFEEQLPYRIWMEAEKASETCDLMLVAGTSLADMPSARLPVRALDNRAKLILVNKSDTFIDVRADIILRGDVADLMPLLAREVTGG